MTQWLWLPSPVNLSPPKAQRPDRKSDQEESESRRMERGAVKRCLDMTSLTDTPSHSRGSCLHRNCTSSGQPKFQHGRGGAHGTFTPRWRVIGSWWSLKEGKSVFSGDGAPLIGLRRLSLSSSLLLAKNIAHAHVGFWFLRHSCSWKQAQPNSLVHSIGLWGLPCFNLPLFFYLGRGKISHLPRNTA